MVTLCDVSKKKERYLCVYQQFCHQDFILLLYNSSPKYKESYIKNTLCDVHVCSLLILDI